MNIRQLEYFIVMAETQQITEAAQQLYIAQPPLSRSLQRLENELGVVLFTRTKKGIELTDTGKVLYEKGRLLLKNYKDMLNVIKETEEGVSGTVRIGTGYPPQFLCWLAKFFPYVNTTLPWNLISHKRIPINCWIC